MVADSGGAKPWIPAEEATRESVALSETGSAAVSATASDAASGLSRRTRGSHCLSNARPFSPVKETSADERATSRGRHTAWRRLSSRVKPLPLSPQLKDCLSRAGAAVACLLDRPRRLSAGMGKAPRKVLFTTRDAMDGRDLRAESGSALSQGI